MAHPPRVVKLYRRRGCALCDEAERMLAPLARRLHFRVEPVDIEADDALLRRYVFEIPVVAVDGRDVVAWPFSPPGLEELLRMELTTGTGSRPPGAGV